MSSSLRNAVDSFKTGEDEDEDMELAAKDVASSVRRNKISEERLTEAVTFLDKGVEVDGELIGVGHDAVPRCRTGRRQSASPTTTSVVDTLMSDMRPASVSPTSSGK